MKLAFKEPIKTEAGYYKGEQYYFDVFLAPPKDREPPLPTEYKQFRARVENIYQINILLTKSQVQDLGGLDLQNMIGDLVKNDKIGGYYRSYPQFIECMLPISPVSDAFDLFQIQEILQGIQVLEDDKSLGDPQDIIVGCDFLSQLGFNIFRHHPKMMHTRITEAGEMKDWVLDIEGLGMYEIEDTDPDVPTEAFGNPSGQPIIIEDLSSHEENKLELSKADAKENLISHPTRMENENSTQYEEEAGAGLIRGPGISAKSKKIKKMQRNPEQIQRITNKKTKKKERKKKNIQSLIDQAKTSARRNSSLEKGKTQKNLSLIENISSSKCHARPFGCLIKCANPS